MAKFFEAPTAEKLEDLKAEHGDDMLVIDYDEHTFVVALPADDTKVSAYYKRFIELHDQGKREEACKSLIPALVVYPSHDEVKAMAKRRPALTRFIGFEASDLLGVLPATAKKD